MMRNAPQEEQQLGMELHLGQLMAHIWKVT